MGLSSTKPFMEMLEEAVPPTPPPRQKKFLSFDPRSPTNEITRTPIQVDKTPDSLLDPRSPSVGISRTPIHGIAFQTQGIAKLDPRSPTNEITRTPIQVDKTLDSLLDPRSPSVGISRTPIHGIVFQTQGVTKLDPRSPTNEITRTPIQVDKTPDSLLDPRSPSVGISRTPIHGIAFQTQDATSPVRSSEESADVSASTETPTDLSDASQVANIEEPVPLLSKPTRNRRKVKKLLLPQIIYTPPGESGVGKQGAGSRSPLTTLSQSCRSPLQAKDNTHVDSPRAIVQRKQAIKLSMKLQASSGGTPGHPSSPNVQQHRVYTDDKENMS